LLCAPHEYAIVVQSIKRTLLQRQGHRGGFLFSRNFDELLIESHANLSLGFCVILGWFFELNVEEIFAKSL
jgi:hypothetical protein